MIVLFVRLTPLLTELIDDLDVRLRVLSNFPLPHVLIFDMSFHLVCTDRDILIAITPVKVRLFRALDGLGV